MKRYYTYSITELSQLIKEQKVSPVDIVKESLERIARIQPKINAFITVVGDEAIAEAQKAEDEIAAGQWRGPLHGIPVAFKDMYDTAGLKTTAAFEHFANRVPQKDAVAVTKLKDAGAIIIGKTNMHTLAMGTTSLESFYGPVKNPWNTDYIAGGSSGGSAAAVAAGLCFATIDTDAVGSTRLPAACCGVVGYKCTNDMIDNSGILDGEQADPFILKIASVGIQARHVSDIAVVGRILSGNDFHGAKDSLRIGVVANFDAAQPLMDNLEEVAFLLKKQSFMVTQVEAPFDIQPDMAAMDKARTTVNETIFADIDIMLLPTLATTVPEAADLGPDPQALSPQNTFFVNYLGLPAISIPSGIDEHGLPMSVQLVGKANCDDEVVAIAEALAKVLPTVDYTKISIK
jgi:aspartyl-tRNA(Asn)/glutamyl-tRNA(Gln) amidotransferase subunit A